ncbi:MAG: RtcB family protein [Chloroflexota bacterium]
MVAHSDLTAGNSLLEMEARRPGQAPLRVFASPRLTPPAEVIAALERIASLPVLSGPVVALPDLHHKPQLECPSSVATASANHIVLGLSSPSTHCGMALARTTLHESDLDAAALDALFGELILRLSLERQQPVLSLPEMADVLLRGAAAAIERYDLEPSVLDFMEQRGNALPADTDVEAIQQAIPQALWQIGGWEFALVGKGNHFLEIQTIDQIHDAATARAWNLEMGQIGIMYHADSGHLGALVGRLYAHRRKNTWRGRLREWRLKAPFHLRTGKTSRLLHRLAYHLAPRALTPMPADSEEGQRTLLALAAAGNYAYANRLAVLAALRDALCAVWGKSSPAPSLLWDTPHNGIRRETIEGNELWLHRHNTARALPPSQMPADSPFARTGQPVLLPGTDRTSSYLCVAGEGTGRTLYSVDHGAGRSALQLGRPLEKGAATRRYTYERGPIEVRPHLSDEGIDEVLGVLQAHDIARPVVRLRPLAVLKAEKAKS